MAKLQQRKIKYEFDAQSDAFEALKKLSETPEGNCFHPTTDGSAVTFGRVLAYSEHEGEGLPDGEGHQVTFDLRVVTVEGGNMELHIARKGSGRHFRFQFERLPDPSVPIEKDGHLVFENRQVKALHDFLARIEFLLPMNAYYLLWACIRQFEDRKRKSEEFGKIMSNLELQYKSLLKFERFKEVEEKYVGGIKVTTLKPIETGRNLGSKAPRRLSAKEKARMLERKPKIIQAILEAKNKENKAEIARRIGISEHTLRNWLKSINVKDSADFHALIRKVEREVIN